MFGLFKKKALRGVRLSSAEVQAQDEEKLLTCVKCKKKKRKDEGTLYLEGSTYCCKKCCGDPKNPSTSSGHKKKEGVCEFC